MQLSKASTIEMFKKKQNNNNIISFKFYQFGLFSLDNLVWKIMTHIK